MRTIPLLPCGSIDEIAKFADHLGFLVTYRQVRPNPYVALDRDGLELHYFGIPGFRPEDSYGSCVVITDDIEALFDAFAAGLRAAYGKLPVSGFPRITRPRRRKNNDNRTGFSLVDPSGNWIRVTAERSPVESSSDASVSRLRSGRRQRGRDRGLPRRRCAGGEDPSRRPGP